MQKPELSDSRPLEIDGTRERLFQRMVFPAPATKEKAA
jgi:hypothetical protein